MCQWQHKHTLANITNKYMESIDLLESLWKTNWLTLTEIILAYTSKYGKKKLFVSVESNTFNYNNNFPFTNKYNDNYHNRIVDFGPNLFQDHGEAVLKIFSPVDKPVFSRLCVKNIR